MVQWSDGATLVLRFTMSHPCNSTERDKELRPHELGSDYWKSSWPRRSMVIATTSHLVLLGLGGWLVSSPEHAVDVVAGAALIGIVLHIVVVLQRDRSISVLRVLAKGLLAWLVCCFVWLIVFWCLALFTTHNALIFGLLAAPALGLLTSGILIALRVGRFGRP